GGYVPGVISCLLVMVGFPLVAARFASLPAVDPSRLVLFIGVSMMISRTAQTQRRAREAFAITNEGLGRRVQERTRALSLAADALRESEKRTEFALEAAGMGRFELDLDTGAVDRSLKHDQIFGYDTLQPEWTWKVLLEHVLPEDRALVAER